MAQSTIPTLGMDLGDRYTHFCLLPVSGEDPLEEGRVRTTPDAVDAFFRSRPLCRVVLEVGTHSPWLNRLAEVAGHETFVAKPRELAFIYGNIRKCDGGDAERLARVGRLDPKLLSPIRHRGEEVQRDLLILRARDVLVSNRTRMVNAARGLTKALGSRISGCSATTYFRQDGSAVAPGRSDRDAFAPSRLHRSDHATDPRPGPESGRALRHEVHGDGAAPPGPRGGTADGSGLRADPRKPGGQPGHKGKFRELVPTELADDVVPHFPENCEGCGKKLTEKEKREDPDPAREHRHQQWEIPPIKPRITEHQCHLAECIACGTATRATLPKNVTRSMFGPTLMALVVLLTGAYRMSKRSVASLLSSAFGMTVAVGSISNIEHRVSRALQVPVEILKAMVKMAKVVYRYLGPPRSRSAQGGRERRLRHMRVPGWDRSR